MSTEDELIDEITPDADAVVDEDTVEASKTETTCDIEGVSEDMSEDNADQIIEDNIEVDTSARRGEGSIFLIDPAYNKLLPVSLLAALIGLLLGSVPAIAFVLIANKVFYPFFVATPLFIYLFNSLLKGGRDIRALITTIVFSLLSSYLSAVTCQVALFVSTSRDSIFQIPVIPALVFGRRGVLPASASAYAYPLVFTILGIVIAGLLLRGKSAEFGNRNSEFGIDQAESESEAPES